MKARGAVLPLFLDRLQGFQNIGIVVVDAVLVVHVTENSVRIDDEEATLRVGVANQGDLVRGNSGTVLDIATHGIFRTDLFAESLQIFQAVQADGDDFCIESQKLPGVAREERTFFRSSAREGFRKEGQDDGLPLVGDRGNAHGVSAGRHWNRTWNGEIRRLVTNLQGAALILLCPRINREPGPYHESAKYAECNEFQFHNFIISNYLEVDIRVALPLIRKVF
jgi:hypothetical protein